MYFSTVAYFGQNIILRSLLSASINASVTSNETYQRYEKANQTLWQVESAILQASGLLSDALAELQLPSLNRTLERAKWATNAANYTRYGAASVNRTSQGQYSISLHKWNTSVQQNHHCTHAWGYNFLMKIIHYIKIFATARSFLSNLLRLFPHYFSLCRSTFVLYFRCHG